MDWHLPVALSALLLPFVILFGAFVVSGHRDKLHERRRVAHNALVEEHRCALAALTRDDVEFLKRCLWEPPTSLTRESEPGWTTLSGALMVYTGPSGVATRKVRVRGGHTSSDAPIREYPIAPTGPAPGAARSTQNED